MTQITQTVAQTEEKKPGINLPVDLIRRVKSAASLQGITFKQYVADALESKLRAESAAKRK